MLGVNLRWTNSPSRVVVGVFVNASLYRNQFKLGLDEPLGSNADFTRYLDFMHKKYCKMFIPKPCIYKYLIS